MSGLVAQTDSPVEEVTSLGKDAVLGDPETQYRTEHHRRWQQQVEVLPEHIGTQEVGDQVCQDHQQRVEEHLDPNADLGPQIDLQFLDGTLSWKQQCLYSLATSDQTACTLLCNKVRITRLHLCARRPPKNPVQIE